MFIFGSLASVARFLTAGLGYGIGCTVIPSNYFLEASGLIDKFTAVFTHKAFHIIRKIMKLYG